MQTDGCGDLSLHAWSADGTQLLTVSVPQGLLEEAWNWGGSHEEIYFLPDPALDVRLSEGLCVDEWRCNDAWSCTPMADRQSEATMGRVQIALTGVRQSMDFGWEYDGTATVTLCDVWLTEEMGFTQHIGAMSWTAPVGWLPGR